MSDLKVSPLIKTLSDNYLNNRITFAEYRLERKAILRQIDSEFNQRIFDDIEPLDTDMNISKSQEDYAEVILDQLEQLNKLVEPEKPDALEELNDIEFNKTEEEQVL